MKNLKIQQFVSDAFGGNLKQNTFVVSCGKSAIIIDAGTPIKDILPAIKNKKVEGVILTHLHFDHIAFLKDYLGEFGCKFYAHKDALSILKNSHTNLSDFFVDPISITVSQELFVPIEDNQTLEFQTANIKCIATPGHSFCGFCFLVQNNLFCGDTFFAHGVGRTDFHTSSKTALKKSLKKILTLDFCNAYPGHGRLTTKTDQTKNLPFWIKQI